MNLITAPQPGIAGGLAQPPIARHRYTARDLLTTVFYYRRIMLIAFLVPALLGVGAARLSKPSFVAQARLLILYGSEYIYKPADSQSGYSFALDRNEIVQGELQVMQSTTLAIETLRKVGVDRVYPGTDAADHMAVEAAARRFATDLKLTSIPQSNVLELSFRNRDPEIATAVLRTLIAGYLDRRVAVFQRSPAATAKADQDAFLARLHDAEDTLARFSAEHDIASPDEQMTLLLQQQAAGRQARDAAAQSIAETTARLDAIRQQLPQIPQSLQAYADSSRSQTMQLLTESLLKLQIKRRDLLTRYNDAFPEIVELDRQIASTQAQIAGAPNQEGAGARKGVNPLYQDAQAQAVALEGQLAGLRAKLAELDRAATASDARIRQLAEASVQYRRLKRDRDVLDESYRSFARSTEATQMADVAERNRAANVRVVQPPEAAAALDLRKILIAGGIAVGLIAAIAAMTICNAFRTVFVTVRDVAVGLDLPVVAAVQKQRRRGRNGLFKPAPRTPGTRSASGMLGA